MKRLHVKAMIQTSSLRHLDQAPFKAKMNLITSRVLIGKFE